MPILDGTSERVFEIGVVVRFTEQYLSRHTEYRDRYAGRAGKVTGYRMGAADPTVVFPKDGRQKEQKLFEVRSDALEIVA